MFTPQYNDFWIFVKYFLQKKSLPAFFTSKDIFYSGGEEGSRTPVLQNILFEFVQAFDIIWLSSHFYFYCIETILVLRSKKRFLLSKKKIRSN